MADEPQPPDLEVSIPSPSGLKVTTEQPYRILLVSTFTGSEGGSVSGPLQDGVVEVTADTFEDVVATACPSVNFTTTDPLAAGNVMVEVVHLPMLPGVDWMPTNRSTGSVAKHSLLSPCSPAGASWFPEKY